MAHQTLWTTTSWRTEPRVLVEADYLVLAPGAMVQEPLQNYDSSSIPSNIELKYIVASGSQKVASTNTAANLRG